MTEVKPCLAPYIPIANLIVKTFGGDVEVILHDLSTPQHSVVYVANPSVTHRQTGTGFNHLVEEMIRSKSDEAGMVTNYVFESQGKKIRSSFLMLRDGEGMVFGAFCINVDTTRVAKHIDWLNSLFPGIEVEAHFTPPPPAAKDATVNEIVTQIIDSIVAETKADGMKLSRERRLQTLRFMETRGVFQMKGAVDYAAERLGISKVTVYSDLDAIRARRGKAPSPAQEEIRRPSGSAGG